MTEDAMAETEAPSFLLPEGVLTREVDGELVLLNLRTEEYYGLDPVGADIVSRLTSAPLATAVDALCRDYDVDADVLRADVDALIAELLDAGLLERRAQPL
jgi:hypothetical protein